MKKVLSIFCKCVIGILLTAVGFAVAIWAASSVVGIYNRHEIDERISSDVEIGNTTYYVSPQGNDSNDGKSPATSWQTIEKVNQTKFKPADRILFEGGKTFVGTLRFDSDDIGTPANPIRIASYGKERATINAASGDGISIDDSMGFEISNLNIIGSGRELNKGSGISFINRLAGDIKLDYIRVRSIEVSGFGDYGIRIEGRQGRGGFRNVVIENTDAHDNGLAGIRIFGKLRILALDIFSPGPLRYSHENVTIRRVKAHHNPGKPGVGSQHSGTGIVLSDTDGAVIEDSVAFENGWLCDSRHGGPVGIWAWDSNNIVIQRNESYSNKTGGKYDGGGFDFDGGVANSVMQYNYSHDNDGPGFLLMQFSFAREWTNNTVRYNISENDGRKNSYGGIHIWGDVTNAFIYNNTVISNQARDAQPRGLAIRQSGETPFFGNAIARDLVIANNIFVTGGNAPIVEATLGTSTISFQHNNYYSSDSNFEVTWNNSTYRNLSEWSESTRQERRGDGLAGFSVNPNFAACNIASNPFTRQISLCLRVDSPLIDKGLDLKSAFRIETGDKDFRGMKIPNAGYEIGAFEVNR